MADESIAPVSGLHQVVIYGLVDPRTNQLRYIGQTRRKLEKRLSQHITAAKRGTSLHSSAWIRGLVDGGLSPECFVVETLYNQDDANSAEQFWIEYFKFIGCDLVNRAIGGGQVRGWRHTTEQREKWRRERSGVNAPRYGQPKTPEEIAKLSASMKAVWQRQPHPNIGMKHSEETRIKIREGRAKNPPKYSSESISRRMAGAIAYAALPEVRAFRREQFTGANNPAMRTLNEDSVREIRKLHGFVRGSELAKRFGVSHATICDVVKRRSWKWME